MPASADRSATSFTALAICSIATGTCVTCAFCSSMPPETCSAERAICSDAAATSVALAHERFDLGDEGVEVAPERRDLVDPADLDPLREIPCAAGDVGQSRRNHADRPHDRTHDDDDYDRDDERCNAGAQDDATLGRERRLVAGQ